MRSIITLVAGVLLLIWPEFYINALINGVGAILVVIATVGVLNFLSSNKALIHFVYLTGFLVLGVVGIAVLLFELNAFYVLTVIFGTYLVLDGISSIMNALIFSRRSGLKGWWILIPLSLGLIACGVIIFLNIWWDTPGELLKVIGLMVLYSSAVSIMRLIWLWPIKNV